MINENKKRIKNLLRENTTHIEENCPFNIIENLMIEEYPSNFSMEHFANLTSFKARIDYCQDNLQRISSGSARIVYKIDDEKVLKLARNRKGLGQNEVEIEWSKERYFSDILARVFHYEDNNLWSEMELARKVNKASFLKHVECDIDDMFRYLDNWYNLINGKQQLYGLRQSVIAELDENSIVGTLKELMDNTGCTHGDLCKYNSWGLVTRNGVEDIVLIDYGFTKEVYDTYYS